MSYKLNKPYGEKEKADFIVEYNHNKGLRMKETPDALYALEENEVIVAGVPVIDEQYEIKRLQQERQRLDMLSLTKREVFLALFRAKQLTPDDIKAQITNPEALIEFEYAENYYRGNPLINQIGQMLGYSSDDLDYLFVNKEFPSEESEGSEV